ncbi:MAG: terminase gpA endonuclease subunit [Syntrophaceae bacterium]
MNLPPLQLNEKFADSMHEHIDALIGSFPEESVRELPSEWAERKRILPGGLTSVPGKFSFDITPYLREILDCMAPTSSVQEVYLMKAPQVGGTVGVIENHEGYCIDYGIGPVLYVGGDQTMAEEQMEKRVDEMISSAGLQGKIRPNVVKAKGKSTGDRMDSKSYGGTFMRAVGPNSEGKLRSFPAMIGHFDEMDVWPQTIIKGKINTGNTYQKALRRMDAYEDRRKVFGLSTPKQKLTSFIEPLFEEGDKRYYNWECPDCKVPQPFVWSQMKWEKNELGNVNIQYTTINGVQTLANNPVWFECVNCGRKIHEHEKFDLLLEEGHGGTAKWIPTKKPDRPFLQTYHVNAFYGRRRWLNIVLQWDRSKDDPFLLPDFVNDVLAETWQERMEQPDMHELMRNAEGWEPGYINRDVVFLGLMADIQGDRIEAGVVGFGRNRQYWFIDYWPFEGETINIESECWKKLDEKITSTYTRADGVEMHVQIAFIDSQYHKDQVIAFCDQYDYHPEVVSGVYPIRGFEQIDAGKTTKLQSSDIKTPIVALADQKLKRALYSTLRKKPYTEGFPFGYMHFPGKGPNAFGAEFYKQLTAEEVFVTTRKNGQKIVTIENRKQRRNEVLDIAKLALGIYQFAIDRYFDIENEKRKLQKRKPLQQDNEIFISAMEAALYGDDYTPPDQPAAPDPDHAESA